MQRVRTEVGGGTQDFNFHRIDGKIARLKGNMAYLGIKSSSSLHVTVATRLPKKAEPSAAPDLYSGMQISVVGKLNWILR